MNLLCFAQQESFHLLSSAGAIEIKKDMMTTNISLQNIENVFHEIVKIFAFFSSENNIETINQEIFHKSQYQTIFWKSKNVNDSKVVELIIENTCFLCFTVKNFLNFSQALSLCIIDALPIIENVKFLLLKNIAKIDFSNKLGLENINLITKENNDSNFKILSTVIFYSEYLLISQKLHELNADN